MRRAAACMLQVAATLWLAAPSAAAPIAIGARVPGAPADPHVIDTYTRDTGRPPAIVSYYREWGETVFDAHSLQAVSRRHAVPMITWEPTVHGWTRGVRSTILRTIASGGADRYLRATARSVPTRPKVILLRFGPEMNGGWNAWGARTRGNSAKLYVAAWRHIVSTFRRVGARNVRWVWCPNVDDYGRLPFTRLYPGDRWVDWVALDGYNWGPPYDWQSFTAVFASSYDALGRLTRKPMMIAETGSTERGGNKATWIRNAFGRELPRFSRIAALVWFNGQGETGADFRFNSSPAAARAFRAALRSPRYRGGEAAVQSPMRNQGTFAALPSPPQPKHGGGDGRNWWTYLVGGAALAALVAILLGRLTSARVARWRRA